MSCGPVRDDSVLARALSVLVATTARFQSALEVVAGRVSCDVVDVGVSSALQYPTRRVRKSSVAYPPAVQGVVDIDDVLPGSRLAFLQEGDDVLITRSTVSRTSYVYWTARFFA